MTRNPNPKNCLFSESAPWRVEKHTLRTSIGSSTYNKGKFGFLEVFGDVIMLDFPASGCYRIVVGHCVTRTPKNEL